MSEVPLYRTCNAILNAATDYKTTRLGPATERDLCCQLAYRGTSLITCGDSENAFFSLRK